MLDDASDVTFEVIAAHEAGHAVAAIVLGARFGGIKIVREGNAVAQNIGIGGLSELGYVRTFLAGTAGEEVALGNSNLENSRNDRDQLYALITNHKLLAFADPHAVELIRKYESAHAAVMAAVLDELTRGLIEVIPAEQVIEIAGRHGALPGAHPAG